MISDYTAHGIYLLAQTFTYQSLHSVRMAAVSVICWFYDSGYLLQGLEGVCEVEDRKRA